MDKVSVVQVGSKNLTGDKRERKPKCWHSEEQERTFSMLFSRCFSLLLLPAEDFLRQKSVSSPRVGAVSLKLSVALLSGHK